MSLPVCFERHPGAARAPLPPEYRPRRPEKTVLYGVVHQHLETMLAQARERSEHGSGYPAFVEHDFRKFLTCGRVQAGFARQKCPACGFERLLPFSCKARLCPSCHARRMHAAALRLTDEVLPHVRYRLWTFTLPRPLRYLMARDPEVLGAILGAFVRTVFAWQRRCARADGFAGAMPGAVGFVQLFGGALNANCHAHALFPDGVFLTRPEQPLVFLEQYSPTQTDLERLLGAIGRKVLRLRARLEQAVQGADAPCPDALDQALAEAVQARLPVGREVDDHTGSPAPSAHRCASADGFSLHANLTIEADDRAGLQRVIRYAARQAFASERLHLLPDGRVRYDLRRPWGPHRLTHLTLEGPELLRRLAAILPRPYLNLTRYYGIFAPNSSHHAALRALCTPPAEATAPSATPASGPAASPAEPPPAAPRPRAWIPWAELLRRTYGVDVLRCPRCLAQPLRLIAFITDPEVVTKILSHLRIPTDLRPPAPARLSPQLALDYDDGPAPASSANAGPAARLARAPPRHLA